MNLVLVVENLRVWAAGNPLVLRVWLFGSRTRDDYKSDSDLDVAVELDPSQYGGSDESGGIATWMFETGAWKDELQSLSPYKIQLEQYIEGQTPTIAGALARSSKLIYEKSV